MYLTVPVCLSSPPPREGSVSLAFPCDRHGRREEPLSPALAAEAAFFFSSFIFHLTLDTTERKMILCLLKFGLLLSWAQPPPGSGTVNPEARCHRPRLRGSVGHASGLSPECQFCTQQGVRGHDGSEGQGA